MNVVVPSLATGLTAPHDTTPAGGYLNRRLRVLFVCPRFAPSNAADSHRVRLLLPYLAGAGVDAEVLAVDPRDVGAPVDPWLAERLPEGVPVHRVRAWPLRGWGMGGLAQRALLPLYRRGSALLSQRRFDLVCFSTTEFLLHLLGPAWQSRHGVPFIMDLQDPWVNDYYLKHPEIVPPGGRLKYRIVHALHRVAERRVVPRAAGVVAVSERYVHDLQERYGSRVARISSLVEPFPAEPAELDHLAHTPSSASADRSSFVWRYLGRGGCDMHPAMSVFFKGWRLALDRHAEADTMRLEAVGTTYAHPAHGGFAPSFMPVADRFGLADRVAEQPGRIGYHDALAALASADGLVVFGSDDPSYTASKLYPYLLARRPLLVICHHESPIVRVMRETRGGVCIPFDPADPTKESEAVCAMLARRPSVVPLHEEGLAPYTARSQAGRLVAWLNMSSVVAATALDRVPRQ